MAAPGELVVATACARKSGHARLSGEDLEIQRRAEKGEELFWAVRCAGG